MTAVADRRGARCRRLAADQAAAAPSRADAAAQPAGIGGRRRRSAAGPGDQPLARLGAGGHQRSFRGQSQPGPFLGHDASFAVVASLQDEAAQPCTFAFVPQQLFVMAGAVRPGPGMAPAPAPAFTWAGWPAARPPAAQPALAPVAAAVVALGQMLDGGLVDLAGLPAAQVNGSYLAQLCPLPVDNGNFGGWALGGVVIGLTGLGAVAYLATCWLRLRRGPP